MVNRQLLHTLLEDIRSGLSILLLGPRQTGKTTLIGQLPYQKMINLLPNHTQMEYQLNKGRLIQEVEAFAKLSTKKPLIIIDEVQKVPELMDDVQYLIDKKVAQFLISGSSARKINNLLPGRVVKHYLDPLSVQEYADTDIEELLRRGSLPGIILEKNIKTAYAILDSYVSTYVEEEIRKESLIRNLNPFLRCIELTAIESGNQINLNSISKEIGVSHSTIQSYIQILEECMILERFEAYTQSTSRKRLAKSPKFIFFDLGVRRIAAKEGENPPQELWGRWFEQWVGLELRRYLKYTQNRAGKVYFWRDYDGPEIDWVVKINDSLIPIEVKWTENPKAKDIKHLKTFLSEYDTAKMGYVICRCQAPLLLEDNVMALPWTMLNMIFNQR
jgi:predicted AAA+ superfamily ATPase